MATLRWLGRAPAVNQVDTVQITADDAATTYSVTIGGITISVAGSGSGVNTTASNLQAALAASSHAYFSSITWTVSTDTVTGTGVNGEPFTVSASATGGTGTLSHTAEATQAESPNHFDVAANWSGGSVPTTNDEIIFDRGAVPMLWAIDQNALSLNLVRTERSYTGWIGLNPFGFLNNATEDTTLPEYRETHFKIDADRVEIGLDTGKGGTGQGRVNIDNGDTGTPTAQVYFTAAAAKDTGQLAVDYVASDAQAELVVNEAVGGVGVAARVPGTTATLSSVQVATTNPATRVVVGEGTTLTSYTQNNGQCQLGLAADMSGALALSGGTLRTVGDGYTLADVDIYRGTLTMDHYDGVALATTVDVWNGGVLDLTTNYRSRTVTTITLHPGSRLRTDWTTTITTLAWPNEAVDISTAKPSG